MVMCLPSPTTFFTGSPAPLPAPPTISSFETKEIGFRTLSHCLVTFKIIYIPSCLHRKPFETGTASGDSFHSPTPHSTGLCTPSSADNVLNKWPIRHHVSARYLLCPERVHLEREIKQLLSPPAPSAVPGEERQRPAPDQTSELMLQSPAGEPVSAFLLSLYVSPESRLLKESGWLLKRGRLLKTQPWSFSPFPSLSNPPSSVFTMWNAKKKKTKNQTSPSPTLFCRDVCQRDDEMTSSWTWMQLLDVSPQGWGRPTVTVPYMSALLRTKPQRWVLDRGLHTCYQTYTYIIKRTHVFCLHSLLATVPWLPMAPGSASELLMDVNFLDW